MKAEISKAKSFWLKTTVAGTLCRSEIDLTIIVYCIQLKVWNALSA